MNSNELMNEVVGKKQVVITKLNFFGTVGYNGSQYADRTAWCAVFAGAVLKRSGNSIYKQHHHKHTRNGTEVATAQGDK